MIISFLCGLLFGLGFIYIGRRKTTLLGAEIKLPSATHIGG